MNTEYRPSEKLKPKLQKQKKRQNTTHLQVTVLYFFLIIERPLTTLYMIVEIGISVKKFIKLMKYKETTLAKTWPGHCPSSLKYFLAALPIFSGIKGFVFLYLFITVY